MALVLVRKLSAGVLKIKDRRPIEGTDKHTEFWHILEARDPNIYEPRDYMDEAFVKENHGAILKSPEEAAKMKAEEEERKKAQEARELEQTKLRVAKYGSDEEKAKFGVE